MLLFKNYRLLFITQPSIKKFNLINNYMASKIQPILLGFGVCSYQSTMVSYQKIIKGFLKLHLVFKWELFVSFHAQMVPPFYSVCYSAVYCANLLFFYGYLLSMDFYKLIRDLNLSYMDAWAVSVQLVKFHLKDRSPPAKNGPGTTYKIDETRALGIYLCRAGLSLFIHIQY